MDLLVPLGFAGVVLVASALAAGYLDRAPLSFPMLFLGLGLVLGDGVLGVVSLESDAPVLTIVAVTLVSLVLFLDAVYLDLEVLRRDWSVPALTLGPGTLVTIAIIAVAVAPLFGLPWELAAVVAACLASTDAVTLRDVLGDDRIAPSVRRAIGLEAGVNDLVILPVLLVFAAIATGSAEGAGGWTLFVVQLLIVGPLAGALVGGGGAVVMGHITQRRVVPEQYQSLYGIGLVLVAFVAGEALGASGFLGAYAAGVAVNRVNHDLCDCFLEFGQTVTEVLLLVAFVLFGSVVSGVVTASTVLPGIALALVVLLVARPVAIGGALAVRRAVLSPEARTVIAWAGPRGLTALLLALLVVDDGVPGGQTVIAAVGSVVVVSVVVHGVSAGAIAAWYQRRAAIRTLPEAREGEGVDVIADHGTAVPRLEVAELIADRAGPDGWTLVDVRAPAARAADPVTIPGSVMSSPGELSDLLDALTAPTRLAFWCSCPAEATAARSARRAAARGHHAVALRGGLAAWRAAEQPTTPLSVPAGPSGTAQG